MTDPSTGARRPTDPRPGTREQGEPNGRRPRRASALALALATALVTACGGASARPEAGPAPEQAERLAAEAAPRLSARPAPPPGAMVVVTASQRRFRTLVYLPETGALEPLFEGFAALSISPDGALYLGLAGEDLFELRGSDGSEPLRLQLEDLCPPCFVDATRFASCSRTEGGVAIVLHSLGGRAPELVHVAERIDDDVPLRLGPGGRGLAYSEHDAVVTIDPEDGSLYYRIEGAEAVTFDEAGTDRCLAYSRERGLELRSVSGDPGAPPPTSFGTDAVLGAFLDRERILVVRTAEARVGRLFVRSLATGAEQALPVERIPLDDTALFGWVGVLEAGRRALVVSENPGGKVDLVLVDLEAGPPAARAVARDLGEHAFVLGPVPAR